MMIRKIYDLIPSNLENKKKRIVYKNIENKKGKTSRASTLVRCMSQLWHRNLPRMGLNYIIMTIRKKAK